VQVNALKDVNICKVAAGAKHCLALSQDMFSLYAWGAADKGQLGLGPEVNSQLSAYVATPTIVTFYGRDSPCLIVDVACGPVHSMAKSLDGDVYTWGYTDGRDKMYTGHATNGNKDVYIPIKLEMSAPMVVHPMEAIEMAGGANGSLFLVQGRADPLEDDNDENNNESNVG
jgi:alpha-tubulin suppressor-like RCC1 family protein